MRKLLCALALLAFWSPPAGAQSGESPEPAADELTAIPQELRAGEEVTVSGDGCAPGNQIRFTLHNPELTSSAQDVAEGDGSFLTTMRLPSTAKAGRAWLRATCLGEDSTQKTREAVLLVSRPEFLITWTNVIFGAGAALVTAGIGLAVLSPPSHSGAASSRRVKGRKRRSSGSRHPPSGESRSGVAGDVPNRAALNGTQESAGAVDGVK